MCRRLITAVVLFISINTNLFAQIPVPVREEPRHKPAFQNQFVRVLNVWLTKGDTSLYHIHEIPSMFVFLTATSLGTQLLNENPVNMQTQVGQTWYNPFHTKQIHKVWINNDVPLHALDIELLYRIDTTKTYFNDALLHSYLFLETPVCRIYKVELEAGKELAVQKTPAAIVPVILEGTVQLIDENKLLEKKTGEFYWVDRGRKLKFINKSVQKAVFYLYALR